MDAQSNTYVVEWHEFVNSEPNMPWDANAVRVARRKEVVAPSWDAALVSARFRGGQWERVADPLAALIDQEDRPLLTSPNSTPGHRSEVDPYGAGVISDYGWHEDKPSEEFAQECRARGIEMIGRGGHGITYVDGGERSVHGYFVTVKEEA
jgi:hypothetical protein